MNRERPPRFEGGFVEDIPEEEIEHDWFQRGAEDEALGLNEQEIRESQARDEVLMAQWEADAERISSRGGDSTQDDSGDKNIIPRARITRDVSRTKFGTIAGFGLFGLRKLVKWTGFGMDWVRKKSQEKGADLIRSGLKDFKELRWVTGPLNVLSFGLLNKWIDNKKFTKTFGEVEAEEKKKEKKKVTKSKDEDELVEDLAPVLGTKKAKKLAKKILKEDKEDEDGKVSDDKEEKIQAPTDTQQAA